MSKLPRVFTALCLTLLAATALGAAVLPHAQAPAGEHAVVRAGDITTEVNNTGSGYDSPRTTM